ncbi:MAG: hypothetical protein EA361_17925 [Bacteroidetes bacterium]|nr:MAG: hypothetical protein EA361_17925 [Bacteroidota bacterium]
MEKPSKEKQPEARFEFRSFGQGFQPVHQRMAALSQPVPKEFQRRVSREIYIVSPSTDSFNCKIRDKKADIKKLLRTEEGLEQWNVYLKEQFPLSGETIEERIFPVLLPHPPVVEKRKYSPDAFIELLRETTKLLTVRVKKERFGYMINDAICEFGNVWINGARVETVSAESTNKNDVLQVLSELGITDWENINYLQAIKRVTGLSDKTLMND